MDIREIIENYLEEKNYDGLFYPDRCACEKGDLFPCGEGCPECEPGYKSKCDCGDHDYHISTVKVK